MRLAEKRGVTLYSLLTEYTSTELDYWVAWYNKEPTQSEKIEYMLAQFIAKFIESNQAHPKRIDPADFLIKDIWLSDTQNDVITIRNVFKKIGTIKNGK